MGLEPTHNSHRWFLPVTESVATGGRFLFGGVGLGAAISALEGTSGRPCVWATAQYLSFAKLGTMLDIDVTLAIEGRATTQARAVAHVGGTEILTVNAALGRRSLTTNLGPWLEAPVVRRPDDCPPREPFSTTTSFHQRLEERWAKAPDDDSEGPSMIGPGRTVVWVRLPELLENSAAALAVLGDFVPMGLNVALDGKVGGNSLDNTLRVFRTDATEWFLVDIQVAGVEDGFGHGYVHIWSEQGVLLAVASQSAIIRERK